MKPGSNIIGRLIACAAIMFTTGCGGFQRSGVDGGPDPQETGDGGVNIDGGALPSLEMRVSAAQSTAERQPLCQAISPFYWEIGSATGAAGSGSIGGSTYESSTVMDIASASKLFFGAYVVERFKNDLAAIDLKAMTMRSGYTSFKSCVGTLTVQGCFQSGNNSDYTASNDGAFSYGGGHFQKYAIDLGLGSYGNVRLASELKQFLGSDLDIVYKLPQPAGGMEIAPAVYARFLQKILSGALAIGNHLGEDFVCTLPDKCPAAVYSPAPEAWHYSYGHWVEDAPSTGDGAFSSAGLFGFYPWIDSSKTYYGLVARRVLEASAGYNSVRCGRLIRKAFLTGVAQTD